MSSFPRVSSLKTPDDFRGRLAQLGVQMAFDEHLEAGGDAPLARPLAWRRGTIGNRFAILPMEGWDGTADGRPTELTKRRWRNFGLSGAKLIWGGEAIAVRHDGRANPNQLVINETNLPDFVALREILLGAHRREFGDTDDLLIGLQLTHSGRFAKPNEKTRSEPMIAYQHPWLDDKVGATAKAIMSDGDLRQLSDDFVRAAVLAERAGFAFVDIKHCHGYLGHELLSGFDRPGDYGGSFENRTRFLREIVAGIRGEAAHLELGVRVSIFDFMPFAPGVDGVGEPVVSDRYRYAFGGDGSGLGIQLDEPNRLMHLLQQLGIELVCATAGSPYYNPHIQRPAAFPPSDGYLPPEDPLVGAARQINATAELKKKHADLIFVGTGYSYLQEWLPHVGQRVVRDGLADCIGLGRMVLAYPELPADVLAGRSLARKRICRTFSDCTTAPRQGMVSGCYPLDPFYKTLPERAQLTEIKSKSLPGKIVPKD